MSRYADVLAALREPALRQGRPGGTAAKAAPRTRSQVLAALPASCGAEWRSALERLAGEAAAGVPLNGPFDLVCDVIRPWSQEVAVLALRGGPARRPRLLRFARSREAGGGRLDLRRKLVSAEFEFHFRRRPGDRSVFIGISETLPAFLAGAWLALLRNPSELARLRQRYEWIPGAIEELLRYAGPVHSLVRFAAEDADLAGIRVRTGDRVVLKLASANRDPEQFPDPGFLNVRRRTCGHLALGHGEHSCPGAALLRTASAVITRTFLEKFANLEIHGEIEWSCGEVLASPPKLAVRPISH